MLLVTVKLAPLEVSKKIGNFGLLAKHFTLKGNKGMRRDGRTWTKEEPARQKA
jgi:hypothetical protein